MYNAQYTQVPIQNGFTITYQKHLPQYTIFVFCFLFCISEQKQNCDTLMDKNGFSDSGVYNFFFPLLFLLPFMLMLMLYFGKYAPMFLILSAACETRYDKKRWKCINLQHTWTEKKLCLCMLWMASIINSVTNRKKQREIKDEKK